MPQPQRMGAGVKDCAGDGCGATAGNRRRGIGGVNPGAGALVFVEGFGGQTGFKMNGVLGLQCEITWEDAEANGQRLAQWLAARVPLPGTLVVLPEMFSSGFSLNPAAAAQRPGGDVETRIAGLALEHGVWIVAGLAVDYKSGPARNEAVVFSPTGDVVARYRKRRLFAPGGEHLHYAAGDGPVMFDWGGIPVGLFICYDLRFPELFRAAAARWRPELFVVIANWPDTRTAHWVKLLQARAIENQAWVLGVNRVGEDPSQRYAGRSMLVNPWGETVVDGGEAEGWVEGLPDIESLRRYREKLPFLDDLKFPC